ncbi:hypothetical protein GMDG_07436 [Pseudogymnoascus destructans 20631-21]|uniref:Uncharacterized protein n=1 Tax=Pseudogymnoascus destructans (strain ATCC MYA-4855 / 20631-21) TaxID=658429 RepID=L8FY91_PSED2|nr:hypothetical protein GMDG_07436 [Pseudogymnoascus destructans 20631-21]
MASVSSVSSYPSSYTQREEILQRRHTPYIQTNTADCGETVEKRRASHSSTSNPALVQYWPSRRHVASAGHRQWRRPMKHETQFATCAASPPSSSSETIPFRART